MITSSEIVIPVPSSDSTEHSGFIGEKQSPKLPLISTNHNPCIDETGSYQILTNWSLGGDFTQNISVSGTTQELMSRTQLQRAKAGEITSAMERVGERENCKPEFVRQQVADGHAVIPSNHAHDSLDPMIIGREFSTKVNANIGNSDTTSDIDGELQKLHTAVHYGADTVMDLSTGDNLDAIRAANIEYSPVPIGTVPIYEAIKHVDNPADITHELLLDIIEKQAEQGVDYMTIHAGVLMEHLPLTDGRKTGIVSRGGSILAQWIEENGMQNPYTQNSRISARSSRNTT